MRRGWLGVRIQNVDDTIAESLDLGPTRGALVSGTDARGPAAAAGIETGDVIVGFDGHDVKESRELPKIVAQTPVGKDVAIVVVRKGKTLTKTVKLGRLDDVGKVVAATDTQARRQDAADPTGVGRRAGRARHDVLGPHQRDASEVHDQRQRVVGRRHRRRRADSPAAEPSASSRARCWSRSTRSR